MKKATSHRANPEEDLEHDVFIQIPPIKKWTARIKIKSIEKAKMHIVEP